MNANIYGLSLGSNVEPEKNIPRCIQKLKNLFKDITFSNVYETPPVGDVGNAYFWNLAVLIKAKLSVEEIKNKMRQLEDELGRARDSENKNAPRIIDIDVLPKEGYAKLAFVVYPMAEIAPDLIEDFTGKTYQELSNKVLKDALSFKKICLDR